MLSAKATPRSRPATRSAPIWVGLILLAWVSLGCAGDGRMRLPGILGGKVTDGSGNKIESVEPVKFGEWHKDVLDCEKGHCQNVYGVMATRGGMLKAQVFAPYGTTDAPDFELVLLDRNGESVARPLEPYGRPRKLNARLEPGSYFLRVAPRGKNQARMRYEIVANFEAPKPKTSSKSATTKASSSKRKKPKTSTIASRPKTTTPVVQQVASLPSRSSGSFAGETPLITAEVLDVEERDGVPAFVLLDAGAASVSLGMRGRLMEAGASIGEIVIIEVLPDGSRAELTGAPTGDFSIDTVADIFE